MQLRKVSARLLRHAADGQPASGQLSRRHGALGRMQQATSASVRGVARHHHVAGLRAEGPDRSVTAAYMAAGLDPDRASSSARPVRARRARLGLQLRGAVGLSRDRTKKAGRTARTPPSASMPILSDGGRHLAYRAARARRGPEAAPRAGPRHRPEVQQRLRALDPRAGSGRHVLSLASR